MDTAAQAWLLPAEIRSVAATFPEVEPLARPAITWGAVAIAGWQAAAVIGRGIIAGLGAVSRALFLASQPRAHFRHA